MNTAELESLILQILNICLALQGNVNLFHYKETALRCAGVPKISHRMQVLFCFVCGFDLFESDQYSTPLLRHVSATS